MENMSHIQNCNVTQRNLVLVGTYSVVFIMGLSLNFIALVIFYRYSQFRSHTIVYMSNLALADLLLVCTLPWRIYYHLDGDGLPQSLCEGLGLVLLVNMYGSIFLLSCISLDRCMAVCWPLSQRVRWLRGKTKLVCLGIWLLSGGASVPIYFLKKRQIAAENCFGTPPIYATQTVAIASSLSVGFTLPLFIMLICSWMLLRAVSRSAAAQMDVIDLHKIQHMIGANLLVFLLCFLPYHVTLVLLYARVFSPLLCSFYQYSLMLACCNAALDPVAYYFTAETFMSRVDLRVLCYHGYNANRNQQPLAPLNT